MPLSKEEKDELAALEKEEREQAAADADAVARQSLEAKRMRKRLAAKHGKHGLGFVVVELNTGMNVAMRRPLDVDASVLDDPKEGEHRTALENYVLGLVLEPSQDDVRKCFAEYPGVVVSLADFTKGMTGRAREEDVKK